MSTPQAAHPVVPIVIGDRYIHDFYTEDADGNAVGAGSTYEVVLLSIDRVVLSGVTITATVLQANPGIIRVQCDGPQTALLAGLVKNSGIMRLRDTVLDNSMIEWEFEMVA